jgi:hypothetical protein
VAVCGPKVAVSASLILRPLPSKRDNDRATDGDLDADRWLFARRRCVQDEGPQPYPVPTGLGQEVQEGLP